MDHRRGRGIDRNTYLTPFHRAGLRILLILLLGFIGIRAAPTEKEKTIAVIPKGTTHEFWQSVHAGAVKATREIPGIKIIWQGPLREDDRNSQINIVQAHIARRTDAIVLAPLDARALRNPIRAANVRKIPVVIIDSDIERKGIHLASFVATDNYKGGQLAGRQMAKLLGGRGNVVMLRYMVGSASTEAREKGFLATLEKYPDIKLLRSNQYAGATAETALQTSNSILTAFRGRQVDGIFCPNESSTFGMLRALMNNGQAGKINFIGFDASTKLIEALKAGQINALVVQNPFKMGYEGVKAAAMALRDKDVPERVDTGCCVVTSDNINTPEIDAIIHPPLKKYLE